MSERCPLFRSGNTPKAGRKERICGKKIENRLGVWYYDDTTLISHFHIGITILFSTIIREYCVLLRQKRFIPLSQSPIWWKVRNLCGSKWGYMRFSVCGSVCEPHTFYFTEGKMDVALWLEKASSSIERKVKIGKPFELRMLFEAVEWEELSKGDRIRFGKDFANAVEEGYFPNVVRIQKAQNNHAQYIRER